MASESQGEEVALLFTAEEIASRVDALAAEIAAALSDPFIVVAVLKGAFVFAADLIRALSRIGRHPPIEFVRLGSYGCGTETSGTVRLRGEPPQGVQGQRILLVDDVLDTGLTIRKAQRLIKELGTAEVRTCVLVHKEGKQVVPVSVDFIGFTIGDRFVVGYGIDCAEKYRDLPYLGAIAPAAKPQ